LWESWIGVFKIWMANKEKKSVVIILKLESETDKSISSSGEAVALHPRLFGDFWVFFQVLLNNFEGRPLIVNLVLDHFRGIANEVAPRVIVLHLPLILSRPVYRLSDFPFGSFVSHPYCLLLALDFFLADRFGGGSWLAGKLDFL